MADVHWGWRGGGTAARSTLCTHKGALGDAWLMCTGAGAGVARQHAVHLRAESAGCRKAGKQG